MRARTLEDLSVGRVESLYSRLGFESMPYYISKIGDWIYVPELGFNCSAIVGFRVSPRGAVLEKKILHRAGEPGRETLARKSSMPW